MADRPARSEGQLREDLKQLRIVGPAGEESSSPGGDGSASPFGVAASAGGKRSRRRERRAPKGKKRGFLRRSLWLLLIGSGVFAGGSYVLRGDRLEIPEVRLTAVTRRDLGVPPVVLTAVGYVTPLRSIVVSSKAQGRIIEMPIEENQPVRRGDLLVRLEDEEARANLALVQAEAADAERELSLTRQLFRRGVRPQTALDRAQTTFDRAQARIKVAQVALEDRVLRAPFDGTVVRKLSDVGEFLNLAITPDGMPGTAVVELADLDQLNIELEINETELRKLEVGMSALVLPEALPNSRYVGRLARVSSQADRVKGTVQAWVRIAEPDGDLLPGMTSKVRFLRYAPRQEIRVARAVPTSSVVKREGSEVVFKVEEGRVQRIPVRTARVQSADVSSDRAERPPLVDGASFSAVAVAEASVSGTSGGAVRDTDSGDDADGSGTDSASEDEVSYVALVEGPPEGTYIIENPSPNLDTGSQVRVAP